MWWYFYRWNCPSTGFPRLSPAFHTFIVTLVTPDTPNSTWRFARRLSQAAVEVIRLKEMSGDPALFQWCMDRFWSILVSVTVDGRNPANRLVSMKPYEEWDILHINWLAGFLPSSVSWKNFGEPTAWWYFVGTFRVRVLQSIEMNRLSEERSVLVPDGWVTCSHAEFCKKLWFYWFSVWRFSQNMTANANCQTPAVNPKKTLQHLAFSP